jgi:Galactose oxidase, central domain
MKIPYLLSIVVGLFLLTLGSANAVEVNVNKWAKLDGASIGQRGCGALIYSPAVKRFMVVGGQLNWNAKGDQPYGDLALDIKAGKWENWYPKGKSFGPKFGGCKPPKFKKYYGNLFTDVAGNNRVNQNGHMWRWLYACSAYDTHARQFYFHGSGLTWTYSPLERKWAEVETATHPAKKTGSNLLWSSMCYDAARKRLVLFGGGNVSTERGDAGTWTFDPASKTWLELKLKLQPPARANSMLAFDPVAREVVLFGGDQLDQLIADTWTFDGKQWTQRKPSLSPTPRAGHAMLWLPKSKKLLLLGGYGYASGGGYGGQPNKALPLDAWTYDAGADKWELIKIFGNGKQVNPNCWNSYLKAAVSDDDVLAVQAGRQGTWLCRLAAARSDAAGTAKLGVKPGSIARREKYYDPKWYSEGLSATAPARVAAEYQALPANKWKRLNPPRIPRPNMDWGSGMYLPKLDVIARFSGGHCAYSGTAPQVFDLKTGRWSIPFAPEFPVDHCRSDAGVPGDWSFKGRPWMPGHTWKATGVDKSGGRLVYLGPSYTWFFDPAKKEWQRSSAKHRWRDVRKATLCRTPKGAVVLNHLKRGSHAIAFLLIDDATGAWKQMPLSGKLPGMSIDFLSTVYDSKRDRILIFAPREKGKPGSVVSYAMKTGEIKWLNPTGAEKAVARMRESVYLPEHDLVMVGGRVKDSGGKLLWLFYDCAENKWRAGDFTGDDPLTGRGGKKVADSVSIGLMYDSKRKLIWMVGQNSELTVLKFDPKTAGLKDLK